MTAANMAAPDPLPAERHRAAWPAALLLALAMLPASPAAALDPSRKITEYIVDFWQEESGLPQKHVDVVYQTRDGYLWIGTRGGLARFDGVRFTTFDDRAADQLPESEVRALAEDLEGGLWIGTYGGGVARLKDGKFTTYSTRNGLPGNWVRSLTCGKDGTVWIGTDVGLARLRAGRITTYGPKDGLPHERILSLHTDTNGTVWIGTYRGLASMSPDGRITNQGELHAGTLNDAVHAVTSDGQRGIWVATGHNGLFRLEDGQLRTRVSMEDGLESNHIDTVTLDPQGTVWMGSMGQLYRYRGGRAERFLANVTKVSGNRTFQMSALRSIEKVFADHEGSVWVGTGADGVARLRDALFTTISVGEKDGQELRVASVLADRRGAVWLGVAGGHLGRLQDDVLTLFGSPSTETIGTIFEDRDGTIWGERQDHLLKLESGRLVDVPLTGLPAKTEPGITFIASLVARDGSVWLADRARGVFRRRGNQYTLYSKKQGLPGEQVRALAEDSRGGVWIGTRDGGLACLREGDAVVSYSVEQGLPSDAVSAVHVDKDDVVWVATRRGLARVRNGQVRSIGGQAGLPANYFFQIVEDDLGYLWMTYSRGIVRVARQGLNDVADGKAGTVAVRTFGTESGMRSTAMVVPNQPTAAKGPDGRLWFATGAGVTVVDPAAIVKNHVPPPVWVEQIRVDKQAYTPRDDATFPPGQGEVEFSYVGLSFVAPERVRFRYMLEGYDDRWVDADTRRVAYFTNLPPASYRFRVLACNNDGVWNETGHALRFHLQPHWYQRRSVHAGALALFGLMLAGAHRWRVHQHKRRADDLAKKVEEAVSHLKVLRGLLPICAGCKKIRDDTGYWSQMETYISTHSQVDFSHGMCPECLERLYPEYADAVRNAE
jgi:ligand-binding sensor domain-containing protein